MKKEEKNHPSFPPPIYTPIQFPILDCTKSGEVTVHPVQRGSIRNNEATSGQTLQCNSSPMCVCKHSTSNCSREGGGGRVAAVHLAENYGNNNFVLTLPVSPSSFSLPTPVGRHWKPEVRAAVTGIARPKLRNSLGNRSSRQTRRKLKVEG